MKRPSFQFYPGDWLHDTGLRACSLAARGLWIDMLAFMHQAEPYGHLTLHVTNDGRKDTPSPILAPVLARMVGSTADEVCGLLQELEQAGVFSRTADGLIFSRRMVNDEKLRQVRAQGGVCSLQNPNVPRKKLPPRIPSGESSTSTLEPSPSSSSSFSNKSIMSESCGSDEPSVSSGKTHPVPSETGQRLAALLKQRILENNPNAKIKDLQVAKWELEADRMIRLDKRTEEEIRALINWSQSDSFWHKNILSMSKLREQFDRLTLESRSRNQKSDEPEDDTGDLPLGRPQWPGLDGNRNGGRR